MNDHVAPRPWAIGIHGSRGTGKTCYLGSLYGFRALEDSAVYFDDATADYLGGLWDGALSRGEVPQATLGLPTSLYCTMKAGRRTWHAALRDYSGEFVQRHGPAESELRQETRDWFTSCDAVLVFLDPSEEPEALRERLNELGLLLKELFALSADGGHIARPLGLILTKWDVQPGFDLASADPQVETNRAHTLLREHPVLGQFASTLENAGQRVQLFPVSAFGAHRANNHPPIDGPRPFNLHAPLLWALAGAEAMQTESALRRARAWTSRRWPRYSNALREIDDPLFVRGLNDGDDRDQLLAERQTIVKHRGNRRLLITGASLFFVLFVLGWYALTDESGRYRHLNETFNNPAQTSADIRVEKDGYLGRRNPFMRLFGHDSQVRQRWEDLQKTLAQRDFSNIETFRKRHESDGEAEERLRQDETFLASWENSAEATTVQGWKKDDADQAGKSAARLDEEKQYRALQASISEGIKKNRYDEAVNACHRFQQAWPQSSHRPEVEQRLAELQSAADESSWRGIVDFEAQYPNSYEEIVKRADEYAVRPGAKHRDTANELAERTRRRWDRAFYDQVVNANRSSNDANAIISTQAKANAYLNAPIPNKRMQDDVKRWMDWYNRLQQPGEYYVTVRSIQIPRGSDFDPTVGMPTCRVEIVLNGVSHTTEWGDGHNITFAQSLGPYNFQWGHRSDLTVAVEGYHHTWWNDRAQMSQPDETFILRVLNGPLTVRGRDGKDINVNLECEAAVPPALPAYR